MRMSLKACFPACLVLVVFGVLLATCGGGGGGGGSSAALTGLSVSGPSSVSEYGSGAYTATASWDDNTTSTVTPIWSVNSQVASISASGVLTCGAIDADQTVTVTATYTAGGITETATMDVDLTNVTTTPFTLQMLSGQAFFEETVGPGSAYSSMLVVLNDDFSVEEVETDGHYVVGGEHLTGSWSLDASGNLIVNLGGQEPITVALVADGATEMQVLIDDGVATPYIGTLEKIVPVDPAKLPGTYSGSDGYTWVFNATTGSAAGFNFEWFVDSGILKVDFDTGYHGWLYARASSQSGATSYTTLKMAFVELTPPGGFYSYYGGIVLTRP